MAEITVETLRNWNGEQMRRALGSPDRQKVLDLIKTMNMEQAALLQEQQTKNDLASLTGEQPVVDDPTVQAAAEATRVAQEAADRLAAEAARRAAEEAAKPKKIVVDYQVKDDDGNPIGRPTHLEATTEEEMRAKIIDAHVHATRAFHRLKNQKTTFKQQQPAPPAQTDAELLKAMEDLKSDNAETVVSAHRRIAESQAKKVRDEQTAQEAELKRQNDVSVEFLRRHKNDFNNCQANVNVIAEYFKENQLQWTLDNLEIAFHAVEDKLAPVVAEPTETVPPANPVVPVTPTPTATAPVAPQPQPTVTAPVTPPANPVVEQPRPGVNGGIVPGESSGTRPNGGASSIPKTDWAAEIRSWDGPTMRRKMADPKVRPYIDQFFKDRAAGKA